MMKQMKWTQCNRFSSRFAAALFLHFSIVGLTARIHKVILSPTLPINRIYRNTARNVNTVQNVNDSQSDCCSIQEQEEQKAQPVLKVWYFVSALNQ